MKTVKREIVSAVIISSDKKILMGQALPGGVYPDCWHIPGGGVEENESKIEATIREINEETGIDISHYPIELLNDTDSGIAEKTDRVTGEKYLVNMHFNDYKVEIPLPASNISFSPGDDLQNCRWISITDLKNYKLTPPSIKYFKSVGWI
ncbi:NUDIX hydrolase [Candidatus Microgenomates bacterium]|nr:NUDIX hydrolase [Candidatus Microgenomates bacterium]